MSPDAPGTGIGVFGGTFDPPHLGHLAAAQDVHEALSLEAVLFIPAGRPPHKEGTAAGPDARLRMVRAAVEGDPRFRVSDMEIRREGPSFTVDTLRELRDEAPERELCLILGADQWRDFGTWREPAEIARLATLVLLSREGDRPGEVDPGLDELRTGPDGGGPEAGRREVPVTRMDLSSTELRARVGAGRSIRYLVPEAVRRIIEAEKLYL